MSPVAVCGEATECLKVDAMPRSGSTVRKGSKRPAEKKDKNPKKPISAGQSVKAAPLDLDNLRRANDVSPR